MTHPHGSAPTLLTRQRLIRRLNIAVRKPVTVIAAPAGYGKTVLLVQWLAQHEGAATVTIRLGQPIDWGRLSTVLRSVRRPGEDTILVVDDIDAAADEHLVHELTAVVDGASSQLRVLVTSRSRFARALRPLDGEPDSTILTAADLAFTRAEARQLVRQVAGVQLDEARVDCLAERAQGWAVGVHAAAAGVRTATDADAYIEGFGGDERHVSAFLLDEVLPRQPAAVQRFLLETSVLDSLTPSLCDAVTNAHGAAGTLRRLNRSGVFLDVLPGAPDRFAYHPMFRQFLRHELRRSDYGDERTLLLRASAWYEANDEPEAAVDALIQAEEWSGLVRLADSLGKTMFESGRAAELLRWLDALPAGESRSPSVALRRAALHTMLGETRQAAQVVHDLETCDLSVGQEVAANSIRATWAFIDASPESTVRAGDSALRILKDVQPDALPNILGVTEPTSLVMMAASSRARALWYLGDVTTARSALSTGIKHRDAYAPWLVHTLGALALLEAWAGNLRLARLHGVRAAAVAGRAGLLEHQAVLDARLALAHVSRERGNQRRAEQLLDETEAIAARSRSPYTAAILAIERARWHLAAGSAEDGLATVDRYRVGNDVKPPPIVEGNLRAVEAALFLAAGDTEQAEFVAASSTAAWMCPDLAAAGVRVAVARGDFVASADRLERWTVDDAQPRHRLLRSLWSAVVEFERGDRGRGIQTASGVVATAEREGHVRLFVDGGRPVERVLRGLLHTADVPYAQRLVRASQGAADASKGSALRLSKRELEVARYLPTPLSSAEIAERLYISLNTLKTHLRTIYGKLGATNRREAIERAEELGIA